MKVFIYVLPLYVTVLFALLVGVLWVALRHTLGRYKSLLMNELSYCFFMLWGATLFSFTFIRLPDGIREFHLEPFRQLKMYFSGENIEMLRSAWMNCLLFIPMGLLSAQVAFTRFTPIKRFFAVSGSCVALSFFVELLQYAFTFGIAETDDIISNTIGCVLGYLFVLGCDKIIQLFTNKATFHHDTLNNL